MKVILDTNILLSAFFKSESPPYKLVQAWIEDRFSLVTSIDQIEELVRVCRYPKVRALIAPSEVGWLVNRLRDRTQLLKKLPIVTVSPDPADNFLFAMAEASSAAYLVTGDKSGVLAFKHHQSTKIVTARQMTDLLKI
jgi:uncharacterized protein